MRPRPRGRRATQAAYWGRNGRMGMLATRPGRTHRWSFREDADGLTPRLNLPARIGELERAREVDTTGAKGGLWSPKAGLGKVSEVWAFKRPYTGRGGARARVGSSFPDGYRCFRVHYRCGGSGGSCGIGLEGSQSKGGGSTAHLSTRHHPPGRAHRWTFRGSESGSPPRSILQARVGGLERAFEAE